MSPLELSADLRKALDENRGSVQGPSYVLISAELYREMMGLGSEEALKQSLDAIEEGLRDVEAGRVHDINSVFRELDEDYEVHR